MLIDFGDPRSRHWQLMRRETMPPQAMLARRMEALTLGVLGQLGATANWHRIAREWLFGDPPSTELGELEEPFHTRGGRPDDAAVERRTRATGGRERLRAADPVMARLIDEHGAIVRRDLKRERPGDAYGALLRSIVGQQLSTKAARDDLRADAGAVRRPRAHARSSCSPRIRTRSAPPGSRAPKISYLRDLAEHVEDGELELDRLDELPDEEVIEQLTAVKGIGEWSAHMFLMFHLGRPDVLPVGDQGIRHAVQVAVPAAQDPRRRSGSRRSRSPGARTARWPASTSGARSTTSRAT